MRGKKTDPDFLTNFISRCVGLNKTSQEEIVQTARSEIQEIDNKIIEVEKLKLVRSKLLDVINVFETDTSSHKEEVKILSFFSIQHPNICKYICTSLKKESLKIEKIPAIEFTKSDLLFCIKQLQEHKVIARTGEYLIRGIKFDDYMKFVLCEV